MDVDALIELETAVWQALADGDADTEGRQLADDFIGVSPTGWATRADHLDQLAAGPTVRTFELSEARLLSLSASAALLSYRAVYVRAGPDAGSESMYVSSLWCLRDGIWVNVFSQDTPDTGVAVV